MSVLQNRFHQQSIERFLYELNQLIQIVAEKKLPPQLLRESAGRIEKYIDFLITFNKNNANALQKTENSTPNSEDAKFLSADAAKHLHAIATVVDTLKKDGVVTGSQFDEFCRLFLDTQATSATSQTNYASSWAPSPAFNRYDIDSLIERLCQTRDDDRHVHKLLKENQGDYPTEGFLSNLAVLNFVQNHLSSEFNAAALNRLLDANYGRSRSYNQRYEITISHATLYPYLRFALVGPVQNKEPGALVVRGQRDLDLVQMPQEGGPQTLDLLHAVLRGGHKQDKIHPVELVNALIGGESNAFETYQVDYQVSLPPLIFHFIENSEATKLLLKNILYVEKFQHGFRDNYRDTTKYQPNNAAELLKLVTYVYKNAQQSGSKSEVVSSFLTLVANEFKAGKDAASLRKLYEMRSGVSSETLAIEGAARQQPLSITDAVLAQGLFSSSTARGAGANSVKDDLVRRIDVQLQDAQKKYDGDKGVNDLEQHYQKKTVLHAAKDVLSGKAIDFEVIKRENPRYSEGLLSHKTRDLIAEVDNFLKAHAPSGPTMST
ncbi:MAG: hypothetical protein NTZ67_07765 [Gammaproteobacteria bacterium]|nr:hypothetical protein [Gammaproteobacteria bacterium]